MTAIDVTISNSAGTWHYAGQTESMTPTELDALRSLLEVTLGRPAQPSRPLRQEKAPAVVERLRSFDPAAARARAAEAI